MTTTTTILSEDEGKRIKKRTAKPQRVLNKRYQNALDYDRRRKKNEQKREESGKPLKKHLSNKSLRKKKKQFYTTNPEGSVGVLIRRPRLQRAIKQHTEDNKKLLEKLTVLYPKLNLKSKQSKGAVNVKLLNLDKASHDIYEEIATHVTHPRTGVVGRVTEQQAQTVFNRWNI